ncbi:MAG: hypothetical protein KBG15_16760 [Kofleriaceae bacterium]|nr:hypothetical protein [Kofleriaceae bacterium]
MSVVVKPIASPTCAGVRPARSASTLLQFLRARARGTRAPGSAPQRATIRALDNSLDSTLDQALGYTAAQTTGTTLDATSQSPAAISKLYFTASESNDARYRIFIASSRRLRLQK